MTVELTEYPILATRSEVVLPGVVAPLEIGRKMTLRAIDAAMASNQMLVVIPQRDPAIANPVGDDLAGVGVLAEVVQITKTGPDRYLAVIRGIERHRIDEVFAGDDFLIARVAPFATVTPPDTEEVNALAARVREALELVLLEEGAPEDDERETVQSIDDIEDLVDVAAAHLDLDREHLLDLLQEENICARLESVLPPLERLEQVLKVRADIRNELQSDDAKAHRESVLRQRLRSIMEELGEEPDDSEVDEYSDKLANHEGMPKDVKIAVRDQLKRMRHMQTSSPEYNVARTYVEWLFDIPFGEYTEDTLDVPAARAILEADHAGLQKVKKRILEFIAVRKLAPDKQGPILCLVGPPGVGKTSLGRSVATALGREYVRISLGGVRDDSEIRGHRRTYIGALPGRIISGLKKAGSMNPVFILDEIDKMSDGARGDPASAMLEVLDPDQNKEFIDHYIEVPVDVSRVMFIATANQLETIPAALLDRLEIIELAGYTEDEKLEIARDHLLPKQLFEHGLERDQLIIEDAALVELITHYTREAGVRNIEREIASICRAAAVDIAVGGEGAATTIGREDIVDILGPPRFFSDIADDAAAVGVATGLAWTPVGGLILFIEARKMPGKGKLRLTGQLGDVMQESALAAQSWVRANADELGIELEVLEKNDLHIHLPAGAIRKDGPSAGVALTAAITSVLTDKPLMADVAITGEVTLRGLVLPVGGIKSKVLAAHRAGIKTVVLPERNRKDLYEIPESVRSALDIRFVERVGEALAIAFGEAPLANDDNEAAPAVPPVPATPKSSPIGDLPQA